jgi:predicted acylesterase/phospholipase RssA
MKYFTHLVFSGSAIRSICLLGILRYIYFNKLENHIKNVAGTSMGSFFGLAFALKIPVDELEEMIIKLIQKDDVISICTTKFLNLFSNLGFNDSKLYVEPLKDYIKKKYNQDDMTFVELSKFTGVNLYVSSTKINDGTNFIFNVNDTPNVSVFDAVASSMAIPVISKPVIIGDNYYVDGCITNNLPYEIFSNINQDDILNVVVYIKNDYKVVDKLSSDDISFIEYYKQIIGIIYASSLHHSYISKIDKFKNPLIINQSPFKSFYNFEFSNNNLFFNIHTNDIENLILQGFKDITIYMKQFEDEDENGRELNVIEGTSTVL